MILLVLLFIFFIINYIMAECTYHAIVLGFHLPKHWVILNIICEFVFFDKKLIFFHIPFRFSV